MFYWLAFRLKLVVVLLILETVHIVNRLRYGIFVTINQNVFFQECRPVFCEGNHLVSKDNSCPDSDVDVLIKEFGLCLNITFDPAISLITFRQLMSNISNILPMWGNPVIIDSIFYKMTDELVLYAILIMSTKKNRTYSTMIKRIKRILAHIIVVRTNNERTLILQNISDYCGFSVSSLKSSRGKFIPFWMDTLFKSNGNEILGNTFNESDFIFEQLETSEFGIHGSGVKTQITKLSICRQVEFMKHEATVVEDVVLYVNLTGRLVFDFVATRDMDTADVNVRVCLEDFPYDELRMSSASPDGFDFPYLMGVLFCTMTSSLCIHV